MSYQIKFSDFAITNRDIRVEDQSINLDTSLAFVGKNFPGYSQYIGENFLHLLENFASTTAPSNAIKGQLWYDTSVGNPQLKVRDSTNNWVPASGIIKTNIRPSTANKGDLWVNSDDQQLYLYTGLDWILVGPQFNDASRTGFIAERIVDRSTNLEKVVVSLYIESKRVAIVSKDEFIPKNIVEGFNIVRQGITLSSEDFDGDGVVSNKFWGVSEKSESLIVGNIPVPSANFLRNDSVSTTNFGFNVRNASGIGIGPSLETSIASSVASGTVISQQTPGALISIRTTAQGETVPTDVVVFTADKKVGINKTPTQALDVNGNFAINGTVRSSNTTESTSISTGSATFAGGVGVARNLNIGQNLTVSGQVTTGTANYTGAVISSFVPATTEKFNIGSSTARFNNVFSKNLEADVVGKLDSTTQFLGNFIGTLSGSAASLINTTSFSITGDVISTDAISYNGTQSSIVLNTVLSGENVIGDKPPITNSFDKDVFLILTASDQVTGDRLRQIRKEDIFRNVGTVPAGSIFPYAGATPPSGYLFCDGSEQSINRYPALFAVLGYRYRPQSLLLGFQTFGLPDLRGRVAVGRENMDNANTVSVETVATGVTRNAIANQAISATFVVPTENISKGPFQIGRTLTNTGVLSNITQPVITGVQNDVPSEGFTTITASVQEQTALAAASNLTISSIGAIDAGGGTPSPSRIPTANVLGNVGGSSQQILTTSQLPQHSHNLKDSVGTQFYAVNSSEASPTDPNVVDNIPGGINFATPGGLFLSNTGGVSATDPLNQPVSVLNPYQTINYIIFTGIIE
jgi:microcystin-dependent protein